jgi:hypothetical protein
VPLHRRMEHSVKTLSQRMRAPCARARSRSRARACTSTRAHVRGRPQTIRNAALLRQAARAEGCRQRGVGVPATRRGRAGHAAWACRPRGVGVLQRGALRQVCVPEAWPLRRMDSHRVVRPSPFEALNAVSLVLGCAWCEDSPSPPVQKRPIRRTHTGTLPSVRTREGAAPRHSTCHVHMSLRPSTRDRGTRPRRRDATRRQLRPTPTARAVYPSAGLSSASRSTRSSAARTTTCSSDTG